MANDTKRESKRWAIRTATRTVLGAMDSACPTTIPPFIRLVAFVIIHGGDGVMLMLMLMLAVQGVALLPSIIRSKRAGRGYGCRLSNPLMLSSGRTI